jgi:F420-dependent methylenetetrahydromethanopterin dehydrogenase
LEEVEEAFDEITEEISEYSNLSVSDIIVVLNKSIKKLKRTECYENKKDGFYFLINEQYVWKDIQDRDIFMSNLKKNQ